MIHYPYNAYLHESILDDFTADDNSRTSAAEEVARQSDPTADKTVRITFSFSISKFDIQDQNPYGRLFHILAAQFETSGFVRSFNTDNVTWDAHEQRDRTFTVENHSTDADSEYAGFLDRTYRKSMESPYDKVTLMNRFNIEPSTRRYPFKRFCREIYRWFQTLTRGNSSLYDSLTVLVTRIDKDMDMFAIPFKGSSLRLNQRDVEDMYRKIWPDASKASLMYSGDFDALFGQKDTFAFRLFLKHLHTHPNMFPDVDIIVRGDGTWKSKTERASDNQFEEWRIFLKFNDVRNGILHTTDDAIGFVRDRIYAHFGPGDRFMLMKQIRENHVFHLTVKFMISVPPAWVKDKQSSLFFDQTTIDIPRKMQYFSGPEKIPVEFVIMAATPDVYGAEVIIDEDGNWTDRHVSWLTIGALTRNFMTADNRYTEIK